MKNQILAVCLLLILVSFDTPAVIQKPQEHIESRDTIVLNVPEKILLQTIQNDVQQGFNWERNMPWIGAIVIGLTTVGANLIISAMSRNSSIRIAKQQMELARGNNERDFKKTVISANKQAWINELRNIISEYISIIIAVATEKHIESEETRKLFLLVTRAELVLTDNADDQKLIKQLTDLHSYCTDVIIDNKTYDQLESIIEDVKLQTRKIIDREWELARNIE